MKGRTLLAVSAAALTLAGSAGGYTVGRVLTVRAGDAADFRPGTWRCLNRRHYVDCFSGDARPYVRIGIRHRCGCVALKVYTLRASPRPRRTDERGNVVYTFLG